MGYQIIWLPKAEERYFEILAYLKYKWNLTVVNNFIKQTENKLKVIQQRPKMFRCSVKKGIYEALITKHNLLIYQVNGDKIELLTFFDTRQNPKKKKILIG